MATKYSSQENSGTFNMNVAWLVKISVELDKYFMFRYTKDFDGMFMALEHLEILTSPKIADEKIETKLRWIEKNKDKWCVRDNESGRVTQINSANASRLSEELRLCLRMLLTRLDDAGILTKLKQDPRKAMGKFDS